MRTLYISSLHAVSFMKYANELVYDIVWESVICRLYFETDTMNE